jgi:hypothetical protein
MAEQSRGVAIIVFAPPRRVGLAYEIDVFALWVAPSGVEARELCAEHRGEAVDRVRSPSGLKVGEQARVELPVFCVQEAANSIGPYIRGWTDVAGANVDVVGVE